MSDGIFRQIRGYPEGAEFELRRELHDKVLHKQTQASITGSANEGANSIVLSGGYEDDEDYGDEVIYTGHGGRDATRKQV